MLTINNIICSAAQHTRLRKSVLEPFFVLEELPPSRYVVSGSTGNPYHLTVDVHGRIRCSCMDAARNGHRYACKHVCFLAVRVFRLDTQALTLFLRLHCPSQIDLTTSITTTLDFNTLRRIPQPEDDCPVCYNTLLQQSGTTTNLVACPDCGNTLHADCARRWLAHATSPTCVFCRSPVWKNFQSSSLFGN